jgi:hypothetical protein
MMDSIDVIQKQDIRSEIKSSDRGWVQPLSDRYFFVSENLPKETGFVQATSKNGFTHCLLIYLVERKGGIL